MSKDGRTSEPVPGDRLAVGPVSGDVHLLDRSEEAPQYGLPPGPVGGAVIVTDSDEAPISGPTTAGPMPTRLPRTDRILLIASVIALIALALLALFSRAAAEVISLWSISPFAGGGFLAGLLILLAAMGVLAGRSWRRYRRLRDVTRIRQMVVRFQGAGPTGRRFDSHIRNELEHYLSDLQGRADSMPREAVNRIRTKFKDYTGDGARDIEELETYLLRPLDRQANSIIERRAVQVAVGTALASRFFDGLIVLWQSVALIDQISQLYAGRPGLWGTLRLLRRGMAMIVFADIADLAAQALEGAVAQKPLALLGGRAAEGTANGLMMLRLGEAVREQCRPVPCPRRPATPVWLITALANQGLGKRATESQP